MDTVGLMQKVLREVNTWQNKVDRKLPLKVYGNQQIDRYRNFGIWVAHQINYAMFIPYQNLRKGCDLAKKYGFPIEYSPENCDQDDLQTEIQEYLSGHTALRRSLYNLIGSQSYESLENTYASLNNHLSLIHI